MFLRLTNKGKVIVVSYIVVAVLLSAVAVATNPVVGAIVAAVFVLLGRAGRVIIEPFVEQLQFTVRNEISVSIASDCRIAIYGMPRSGNTTLIRRLIAVSVPKSETSTTTFDIYQHKIRLDLKGPAHDVAFADYVGQKPSQITTNCPETFFGLPDNRKISMIFFIVDLFPEIPQEHDYPVEYAEFVKRYQFDSSKQILDRVALNSEYVNQFSIEPVFTVCYSQNNLFAVRLFINKADYLEKLVAQGYLDLKGVSIDQYVKKLYSPSIAAIRKACDKNNIGNFNVELISAATGEGLVEAFGDLMVAYSKRGKNGTKTS